MTRIPVTAARASLSDAINRVAYGHERIVLHRRGKDLAALIPVEDLRLLERLVEEEEDRIDAREARKILADPKDKPIPYDEVRRDLGLPAPAARRRRAKKAG